MKCVARRRYFARLRGMIENEFDSRIRALKSNSDRPNISSEGTG